MMSTQVALPEENLICEFCQKEWKKGRSYKNHIICCSKNPNRIYKSGMTGKTAWNKGLTKETDERVNQIHRTRKLSIKNGKYVPHGTKHSEETKQKIRKIRLDFLEKNPDMVPYLLNHYSKGESYPEKYWREVLENAGILFEQEKRLGLYRLDFAINGNINLEIDGDQHYTDKRIIESNQRRDGFLQSNGWSVIRIRWSHYLSLSPDRREEYVTNILKILTT